MKIETKFDIGQTVFYECQNKIHELTIDRIEVNVKYSCKQPMISYYDCACRIHEQYLFETKEELKQIMIDRINLL